MAYAYICAACNHPTSRHTLADGGDLRDGPYLCQRPGCDCATTQDAPTYEVNRASYESRFKEGK